MTTTRRQIPDTARWARTGWDRAPHLLLPGRKFACGTHTGYGLLYIDYSDGTTPHLPCKRCYAIQQNATTTPKGM